MKKPNITSGPWSVLPEECHKPYIRIRGTVLGGRYKIANVITPIYDGMHDREVQETRANATAIAALPHLLEALIEADRILDMEEFAEDGLARGPIRAALFKAGCTDA